MTENCLEEFWPLFSPMGLRRRGLLHLAAAAAAVVTMLWCYFWKTVVKPVADNGCDGLWDIMWSQISVKLSTLTWLIFVSSSQQIVHTIHTSGTLKLLGADISTVPDLFVHIVMEHRRFICDHLCNPRSAFQCRQWRVCLPTGRQSNSDTQHRH